MWLNYPNQTNPSGVIRAWLVILGAQLIALVVWSANASVAAESIKWNTDVNGGLDAGKRNHKYVLADVYTSWCVWCKRLDQDTFSNEQLIKFLNDKFVCVKANAEDNGSGQKLTEQYRVNGYPCALVFDPSGKFIGRFSGYRDAKAYQSALSDLIANPPGNPEAGE